MQMMLVCRVSQMEEAVDSVVMAPSTGMMESSTLSSVRSSNGNGDVDVQEPNVEEPNREEPLCFW
jgi:hypothetical protein